MLEGLGDVDWPALTHAYGPAGDVPGQLRSLRAESPAKREWARYQLYGNIFHQGTTYQASPYAVPFLVELIDDPRTSERDHLVHMLSALAVGYDEYVLPSGVAPGYEAHDPAYAAVGEHVARYRDWLSDGDPAVEAAAAALLAWFPDERSLDALWARMADEAPPASALAAIGLLGTRGDGALAARLAPYLESDDPVQRWGAAVALARIAGDTPPPGTVDELLRGARGEVPELPEPGTVFLYSDMQSYAAESLQLLGRETRVAAVDAVVHTFAEADMHTSLALVHALLPLAFDGKVPPDTPFSALEPHQQAALRAFLEADWFRDRGKRFANIDLMLAGYGLPADANALKLYIRGRRARWWRD